MKKSNFDELVESIRQAGKIRRGEMKPSRRFVVNGKEDVLTVMHLPDAQGLEGI